MSASGLGFTDKSFELLEALEQHENNNKEWFDDHRSDIEERLLQPFSMMLEQASERIDGRKIQVQGSRKTMFRMNRDVRFSEDKRPYKHSVSGLLTPSGTKDETSGVVYAEISSAGGILGGGFYRPSTARLNEIRDRIIEEPSKFNKVLDELRSDGLDFEEIDPVKTIPRGYSEYSDHEHVDYLRRRNFLIRVDLPKQAWLDDSVVDRLVGHAEACAGIIRFASS